jgi:hypothetical protein
MPAPYGKRRRGSAERSHSHRGFSQVAEVYENDSLDRFPQFLKIPLPQNR